MSKFIQLHLLTSYPPSNLNRDDLGRPKTAVMGGTQRLRISSQSLKRAWRESDIFKEALSNHIGIRTKDMGTQVYKALTTGCSLNEMLSPAEKEKTKIRDEVPEEKAHKWAHAIAEVFGKNKKSKDSSSLDDLKIEQLAHFGPEEIAAMESLMEKLVESDEDPTKEDLELLRKNHRAVDIAMFGRMLANVTKYNTEAAVQVSHAITVHKVAVEDDFFTAVDDLNRGEEDQGAGHLGESEFASGLFYNYICINRDLLSENLNSDDELVKKALRALMEAAVKVAPTGKQNSFASRAYASYVLAEKGTHQPRSLSVAFLKNLRGDELLADSIATLKDTRLKMEGVYGECCDEICEMNAYNGEGKLADILNFVAK